MTGKDIVKMSQKELKRIKVINEVINKNITQKEAAEKIDLFDRQIRRLLVKVEEGDKGLIHKSRGKKSNNGCSEDEKEKILELCREKYVGFGPRHYV